MSTYVLVSVLGVSGAMTVALTFLSPLAARIGFGFFLFLRVLLGLAQVLLLLIAQYDEHDDVCMGVMLLCLGRCISCVSYNVVALGAANGAEQISRSVICRHSGWQRNHSTHFGTIMRLWIRQWMAFCILRIRSPKLGCYPFASILVCHCHSAGLVGLMWVIIWFVLAADTPSKHRTISSSERNFIIQSLSDQVEASAHQVNVWSAYTSLAIIL